MEEFVTFEQAKKLKDLGFNYKTIWFYTYDGNVSCEHLCPDIEGVRLIHADYNNQQVAEMYNVECSAPTLAQAQKWFREVYGIDIDVNSAYYKLDPDNIVMYSLYIGNRIPFQKEYYINYESYEQVLSAGINHAVKLLNKI